MDYQVKGVLDSLLQRMEAMEARMLSHQHLEQQEGEKQASFVQVCSCVRGNLPVSNATTSIAACPIHGKKQESTTSSASSVPTPGPVNRLSELLGVSRDTNQMRSLLMVIEDFFKSQGFIEPVLGVTYIDSSTLILTSLLHTSSGSTKDGDPGPASRSLNEY
jgi:hypothetical protein